MIDWEDVQYEDSVSSDTFEEQEEGLWSGPSISYEEDPFEYPGPTGEDFHLEMDYEDRCAGEYF